MAWFKVDDGFYSSTKFLSIPREYQAEAAGAWLLCGTWSADKMTDGLVPYSVMNLWEFDEQVVFWLCKVGLWDHLDDGMEKAIRFHDWLDYQPSKEQLMAKNERISKARADAANARWEKENANAMQNNANAMQNDAPEPEPEPEPVSSKELTINTFDEFWSIWPKRRGVGEARKAWAKAIRKEDKLIILDAARQYAQSPFLPEMQFIPLASTWLNQERWGDDLPQPTTASAKPTAAQRNLSTVEYFRNQEALAVEA